MVSNYYIGEQTVTISPRDNVASNAPTTKGPEKPGNPPQPSNLMWWPTKYGSASTSPLKIVVEPGKVNEFNFNLED